MRSLAASAIGFFCMSEFDEHRRRRWMRANANLYIRHDVHRFMPPGSPLYVGEERTKYFFPEPEPDRAAAEREYLEELATERDELLQLKSELAAIRADIRRQKLLRALKAYDPNQPRVPAGNPDGGQWTSGGGGGADRVRLAAGDKPRLGPAAIATIAAEAAKRAIETFRRDNLLQNLFGGQVGTVTYTEFNGEQIFGSNSTSPTYTSRDRAIATALRDTLVEKYPEVMNTDQLGRRPNEAVFHAETTILMRAAWANGGSLSGRSLEIYSDRLLCPSCDKILPHIGLEVGDPTVTFIQPNGRRKTMRNGAWAN
jgi:hypothetical protein